MAISDQRQHRQRDQRQLPVHAQHDGDDSGQHEHVFEDRHHAGGEHFVQRVHVGGDARDQPAHGILVVEADVHVLQVAENLVAQIEHHLLPRPLHEVGLQIFEQEAEDKQCRHTCAAICAMPTCGFGAEKSSQNGVRRGTGTR